MNPIDAIKKCYSLPFSGKGRASRSEFWWFFAFHIISIYLIIGVPAWFSVDSPFLILIMVGFVLFNLIVLMNAGFRRLHDAGMSGFYYFVPILNLLFLLSSSDPNENQYGPPLILSMN